MALYDSAYANFLQLEADEARRGVSMRALSHSGEHINGRFGFAVDVVHTKKACEMAAAYRVQWWDRFGYAQLPQAAASKLFATAMNIGPGLAARCLRRALQSYRQDVSDHDSPSIDEMTLRGVRRVMSFYGREEPLLAAYRGAQAGLYREFVALNPRFAHLLPAMLERANV